MNHIWKIIILGKKTRENSFIRIENMLPSINNKRIDKYIAKFHAHQHWKQILAGLALSTMFTVISRFTWVHNNFVI